MPAPPPPPPPPSELAKPTPSKAKPQVQPDRGALLKSIQKGTALKKTVTNDRSSPNFGGKSESKPSKDCPKLCRIFYSTLYHFEFHFLLIVKGYLRTFNSLLT